jgi:hypothetical protein
MKEHSINALPKWARKRIMHLEGQVAELKLHPVELAAIKDCMVDIHSDFQPPTSPIHLAAGDKMMIGQPIIKFESNCRIPKVAQDAFVKTIQQYAPYEITIHVSWRNYHEDLH